MRISDWSSDVCSSDLLDRLRRAAEAGPRRTTLSCGNLAHGFAACGLSDKQALKGAVVPNLAIITAYNDMLSAHPPFARFPELIRQAARDAGSEIGRASCRDRVCQYVYISVVAGYLKKKKKKIHTLKIR